MQVSPNMGSSNYNTIIDTPEEPLLPSYEAAMDILDTTKLPRYRRTFSARFHPYRRPRLKNFDERDRLFVSFSYLLPTAHLKNVVFVGLVRY